jgi:hypothetical protein
MAGSKEICRFIWNSHANFSISFFYDRDKIHETFVYPKSTDISRRKMLSVRSTYGYIGGPSEYKEYNNPPYAFIIQKGLTLVFLSARKAARNL